MKTVLEQALEALSAITDRAKNPALCDDTDKLLLDAHNSIAALKELIAKQGEPVAMLDSRGLVILAGAVPVGTMFYTSAPTIPEGMVLVKTANVQFARAYYNQTGGVQTLLDCLDLIIESAAHKSDE